MDMNQAVESIVDNTMGEKKPTRNNRNRSTKKTAVAVPAGALVVRFYASDTDNIKAPIARAEIELPAPFAGMVVEAPLFAQRDLRGAIKGIDVSLPGSGRYGAAFRAAPVIVTDDKGKEWPTKAKCAAGAALESRWAGVLTEAYYRATKGGTSDNPIPHPVQVVSF